MGKLPSETVVNPRENTSTIILRSGKEVEIPVKEPLISSKQRQNENIVVVKNTCNDDNSPQCKFLLFLLIN